MMGLTRSALRLPAVGFRLTTVFLMMTAVARASDNAQVPQWLQGRASDTLPAPTILSASQIAAMFERPRSAPELLKNLKLAWDQKLLVQPAFFADSNLLRFFNATSITWKVRRGGSSQDINRRATITVDSGVFPGVTLETQISSQSEPAIHNSRGSLPAHVHVIGSIDISGDAIPGFTWSTVTSIFGTEAQAIDTDFPSPHGQQGPPPGKVLMRYSYPGDDPQKYGEIELPQARFLLKQGAIPASLLSRHQPQDSDIVKSILMLESANRR